MRITISFASRAYIVQRQVLDAPTVSRRQLHDITLEPALSCIASDGFGSSRRRRLVIGAHPRRRALIGHFAREISMYGSYELVVEVNLVAIGAVENRIYAFRVFGLVEAAYKSYKRTCQ